MKSILLVEDNPSFAAAALKYICGQPFTQAYRAADYEEATRLLARNNFDGALIDCFFPNKTGSNDISLGKTLVDRLANSDPHEVVIRKQLKSLEPYVGLEGDLAKYTRLYLGSSEHDLIPQKVVIGSLNVIGRFSRKAASYLALGFMKYHEDKRDKSELHPKGDYYGALLEAMERSEANQPLGILIAEQASKRKLPFVLTTSTFHHDLLTQPLYDHASRNGWTLCDTLPIRKNAKETMEFWAIAHARLGKPFEMRG